MFGLFGSFFRFAMLVGMKNNPNLKPYLTVMLLAFLFVVLTMNDNCQGMVIQDMIIQTKQLPDGSMQTIQVPAGNAISGGKIHGGEMASPGSPINNTQPGGEAKPADGEKPAAEGEAAGVEAVAKAEAEKAGAIGTVKRSDQPKSVANPAEFEVRPDADGKIEFEFREQSWPPLLEWLADVSNMTLDWQELPDDALNIATRRRYTLEEARDLFNRHLLIRGYTMLEFEGMLQVAKVKGINRALVPKVDPGRLAGLPPNRFVRTTFVLDSLLAETILPELQVLLSSNGTLSSLNATNRLEAMDSAVNLKEIHRILSEEQSNPENLAREFLLLHVRATVAKQQLEVFLGLQGGSTAGMTPEMAMQMQQQQMAMRQVEIAAEQAAAAQSQAAAQAVAAAGGAAVTPAPKTRSTAIYLVANERQNSVIVHAPPDKMAIIESFLNRIDVATEQSSLIALTTRMKVYRLSSLDPDKFVASLRGMDVLEPATKLEVDKTNSAIIVHASIADHYTINELIERLDGSAREFDVIQLRRLKADEVAGTIKFLMGVKDEDESDNNRRYYYYGQDEETKKEDKFRVGANVRDNQVLLWANDMERQEINKLLVKLGELPGGAGNPSTFRKIEASRSPETLEYLRMIQRQWERGESTPLILPDSADFKLPEADKPKADKAEEKTGESEKSPDGESSKQQSIPAVDPDDISEPVSVEMKGIRPQATANQQDSLKSSDEKTLTNNGREQDPRTGRTSQEGEPIQISMDAQGNLILNSSDPAALDRLERLMTEIAPPKQNFDIFRVEHARATWVRLNLVSYFKDRDGTGEDKNNDFMDFFYFGMPSEKKDNSAAGLSKRTPLTFLADNDTQSIIVQGADEVDRRTIRQLIELWDVPEPKKETDVRRTRLIRVKHSKAESIVTTVKDAYRDLLSATDSSFQEKKGGEDGGDGEGASNPPPRPFNFSGSLALGVDSVTNSIVVTSSGSSGESLMEMACELIEMLDQAARPTGVVQVIQLESGGTVRSSELQKLMQKMLKFSAEPEEKPAEEKPPEKPPEAEQPKPPPEKPDKELEAIPGRSGITIIQ